MRQKKRGRATSYYQAALQWDNGQRSAAGARSANRRKKGQDKPLQSRAAKTMQYKATELTRLKVAKLTEHSLPNAKQRA